MRKDEFSMNVKSKNKNIIVLAVIVSMAAVGLLILLPFTGFHNSKLPESRDIFTLEDTYNMTVLVVFDEEPPIVQFINPNGNPVDMTTVRHRPGSNFIQYFLPNAMPGIWRMEYDPLSNTDITTPYSVYMEHIFIRSFDVEVGGDENRILPVSFEVSADEAGEFGYEIHAVFTAEDNSIEDEILLVKGYGVLNEILLLALDTDKIKEMGGFMLRLTASVQHGQAAITDSAWQDLRLKME
jgi:hypothetical protein